ncbi:lactoylglutathione lyase [Spirochaetia bacterium]|nr:lactoylglutathione lyase [Spirochaetia bacterium]GHU37828.1 lactoylglutathione lyase [Spirochaetia bacterium]
MIKHYTHGIQHIGLPTNDMEATLAFYRILGFEVVHEKEIDCRVCFLKLDSLVIEVYENKQALLKPGAIDHIAIDCTDIEACYHENVKAGLSPTSIEALPFWEKGVRFFKITGPNHETIEFCQIL